MVKNMKQNVGILDQTLRIVVGIFLIVLGFYYGNNWILYIVGVVVLVTGILGYCPIYEILNMSTVQKGELLAKQEIRMGMGQKTKAKKPAGRTRKKPRGKGKR
ncbi:MAG: YgaP family membrane protein [Candidatus Anstonellales archaeon]